MSMGGQIGTAEIVVGADATGFPSDVEKQTKGPLNRVGSTLGKNLSQALGGTLKAGAAVAGAAVAGVLGTALAKGFGRLEQIDAAQAKLKGLGITGDTLTEVMNNALNSVKGTAFGLGDAAQQAGTFIAAGIKPGKELERTLSILASTTAIAGTNMNDVGAIMRKVATSNKLTGESLAQLQNRGIPVLSYIAKEYGVTQEAASAMVTEGKIGFNELQTLLEKNLGPAAKAMGESFSGMLANTGAALGRLGAAMLDPAFQALKTLFPVLMTMTDALTTAIGPLAEQFGNYLGPAVQRFADTLAGIDMAGFAQSAVDAIGLVVPLLPVILGAIAPLLKNLPLIGKMFTAWTGPVGLIIGLFASMLIQSESLRTALGEAFSRILGLLAPLVPLVVSLVVAFTDLAVQVANFVGDALNGLLSVPGLFESITVAVLAGVAAFKLLGIIKTVIAWVKGAVVAFKALGIAMMANPIGLIIGLIAALVAGLVYFFTQTELGQQIWANFVQFLGEAWENIVTFISESLTNISNFFTSTWNGIVSFFSGIWSAISSSFTTGMSQITGFFTAAWQGISDFFMGIWNGIVAFLTPILEFIGAVIQVYIDIWRNIFVVFAAVMVTIWNAIAGVVTTVWNAIVAFITPIVQAIADFIVMVWTNVSAFWRGVFQGIHDFFVSIWNAIVAFATPIIDSLSSFITDTVTNIQNVWNTVWGAISDFFTEIWNAIVSFVTPIVLGIYNTIRSTVNRVQSTWNSVWNSISNFFTGIWNTMKNTVTNAVNTVTNVVGTVHGKVMAAFNGVGDWLSSAGQNLVRGFFNGIESMWGWLTGMVSDFFGGIVSWAEGVLGIQSPSKVFAEIGRDTMRGYGEGIEDMQKDAMKKVANAVDPNLNMNMNVSNDGRALANSSQLLTQSSAGWGPTLNVEAGAIQLTSDDPYKASLLVVDRIAELAVI